MTDRARQAEEGRYPDDDATLEGHAAAVDHLIHTSRTPGIDVALPTFIRSILETGIASLRGGECVGGHTAASAAGTAATHEVAA